jgi:hypothetical protein
MVVFHIWWYVMYMAVFCNNVRTVFVGLVSAFTGAPYYQNRLFLY